MKERYLSCRIHNYLYFVYIYIYIVVFYFSLNGRLKTAIKWKNGQ